MMKRMLFFALFVLLVASSVGANALVVGTDAAYAPFEYIDEAGNYTGFDIELVRKIGEKLGYDTVRIQNFAFDGLLPALKTGRFDLVISAMTITEARAKEVLFSDPYYSIGQVVVVRPNETRIKSEADLKGMRVAVQIGTTGMFVVEEMEGVRSVLRYNTTPEALTALISFHADAAVVDGPVAEAFLAAHPGRLTIVGKPFTTEDYGMAFAKGNEALVARVNQALAELRASGWLAELEAKWLSE